jgi:hypothetical protein
MRFIEEAVVKNGRNVRLVCQDINLRATIDGTTLYVTNEGSIPVYSMKIMKTRQGEIEVQEVSGLGDGDGGVYEIGEVDKAEIVPVVLGEVKTAMQNYTCSQIKIEAEKIG